MKAQTAWYLSIWQCLSHPAQRRAFRIACAAAIWIYALPACGAAPSPPPAPSSTPTARALPTVATVPSSAVAAVRACDASDLKAVARWQGATGSLAGTVTLTNQSPTACSLEGRPQIDIKDGRGRILPTDKAAPRPNSGTPAGEMRPGQPATVAFVWSNWCYDKPAGPITVVVTLPGKPSQIDAPVQGPDGAPLTDAPRCNDPGVHSTLNVGPFERAEQTPTP